MAIDAGQHLLHYRLIEKIGEGGMGVVWRAEDTKLHRQIALKVLPQAMAADPDRRVRFEREARAVAALNHPNIVTLHSVEEADGVHFITMELVEGDSLTRLLPEGGFPLSRLLDIAIPLADAVSRAHRAGITHRDLKPDNVMIDEDGRLRVLDFGLAKLHEPAGSDETTHLPTATAVTGEGKIVGTVAYMSPEQAEGKPVDHRSDIFSLGTILYEMATGTRPFQGDTSLSVLGAILKVEPSSVTEIKPALPRQLGRIVRRCLAKDPDRRYQTALDLRNELEELRAELSVPEAADSRSPARRGWWRAIVVAAIVMVAVATWTALRHDDTAAPRYVPRPVTATAAYDADTSWSPDGQYIVFSRMKDGNRDIYVQDVDGTEAVARVEEPGDQSNPRWSPDGRHLAYVSTAEPGTPVFLVPPEGGTPRKLIELGLPTLSMGAGLGVRPWSPDSRYLLVARALGSGRYGIDRVDVATGEVMSFTRPPEGSNDTAASYSFDGSRVLLRRGGFEAGTMMTVPAEGGEPKPLSDVAVAEAVWRPGDRNVLYTTPFDYGLVGLVELDVDTGETRTIFEARSVQSIAVSPTDRIVFSDFRHDQFVFVVDARTGERRQLTSHASNNVVPTFSPDGRTLAYASSRTGDMEVWLHDVESGAETRATDSAGIDFIADWSPDGRRLLLVSQRGGGQLRLWVASADGAGGARLLVDQPLNWQGPGSPIVAQARWSPDDALIGYVVTEDGRAELWTVAPDGHGAERRLTDITEFVWYGDSRRVLVTRLRGSEKELVAVHLDTGDERVLYTGALRELYLAPDGSAVAFCYGRGHLSMGLAMLRLTPPDDPAGLPTVVGEPEHVVRTEGTWHVHSGGWSPDARQIAYVRDWDYGDIFELVER